MRPAPADARSVTSHDGTGPAHRGTVLLEIEVPDLTIKEQRVWNVTELVPPLVARANPQLVVFSAPAPRRFVVRIISEPGSSAHHCRVGKEPLVTENHT